MEKTKRSRQYFTPGLIVDFMVDLISGPKSVSVLETCAGKGTLLSTLRDKGFENLICLYRDVTASFLGHQVAEPGAVV